jgi:hypothetical protein
MQPGGNLIACKDCGNLVSKSAPTCPRCGAAIKKDFSKAGCSGCLVILLVLFIIGLCYSSCDDASRLPAARNPTGSSTVNCTISVSDDILIVSNTGKPPWTSIEIYINGDPLSGYGCRIDDVKPLDSRRIPLREFTKSTGDRFNPFEKKVTEVWIGGGVGHFDFEKYNFR